MGLTGKRSDCFDYLTNFSLSATIFDCCECAHENWLPRAIALLAGAWSQLKRLNRLCWLASFVGQSESKSSFGAVWAGFCCLSKGSCLGCASYGL